MRVQTGRAADSGGGSHSQLLPLHTQPQTTMSNKRPAEEADVKQELRHAQLARQEDASSSGGAAAPAKQNLQDHFIASLTCPICCNVMDGEINQVLLMNLARCLLLTQYGMRSAQWAMRHATCAFPRSRAASCVARNCPKCPFAHSCWNKFANTSTSSASSGAGSSASAPLPGCSTWTMTASCPCDNNWSKTRRVQTAEG